MSLSSPRRQAGFCLDKLCKASESRPKFITFDPRIDFCPHCETALFWKPLKTTHAHEMRQQKRAEKEVSEDASGFGFYEQRPTQRTSQYIEVGEGCIWNKNYPTY